MLTGSVNISELFTVWTVTEDNWTDHPSSVYLGVFRFSVFRTVFGTTNCETTGTPEFFQICLEQFLFMFILFLSYVYAAKPYAEKLFWKLEATRKGCGYVESLQTFFGV